MAYLGNSPVLSQQEYRNIDNISGSFNGVTTSFPLRVNGVAPVPAPQSSNQCLISVNGVVQKPDDSGASGFRISGGNIIFSAAPTGGQSFFGVILAGADYIYAGENFPDGTVTAPSITFKQDLGTGFYRNGAGEVRFTSSGTNAAILNSSSLTAPSFIPTSSTAPTNGVYLSAANTVAISTGGSGRLFINSSGYTSIGNSSPQALVHFGAGTSAPAFGTPSSLVYVCTAGQTEVQLRTTVNDVTGSIYTDSNGVNVRAASAHPLSFHTSNTERLRITSAGLVGIGSSSPQCQLTNTGNSSFGTNSWPTTDVGNSAGRVLIGNEGQLMLWNETVGAGNTAVIMLGAKTGAGANTLGYSAVRGGTENASNRASFMRLETCNSVGTPFTAIHVDSSQRVGIGTTSPGTYGAFAVRIASGGTSGHFSDGATGSLYIDHASNIISLRADTSNLAFQTLSTERARIDSSGRLLVGTSSESAYSRAIFAGRSDGNAAGLVKLQSTNSAPASGDTIGNLLYGVTGATTTQAVAEIYAARDGGTWTNNSSMPGRLVFATTADGASSSTERMRITNGGFLKASSTGGYGNATGGYHEIRQGGGGNEIIVMAHTASSGPYGINLAFTGASPNDTTSYFLYCGDSTAQRATIRSNGGLANYSANNANLSDRNAKKDISPAADTWDCIKEWEIVNYRYKDQPDDADLNLGVIAQQVAESCPEVITVFQEAKEAKPAVLDDDGNEVEPAQEAQPEKLGIKEQQMYWMAIKALQEAQVRIEQLEAKVAALESA